MDARPFVRHYLDKVLCDMVCFSNRLASLDRRVPKPEGYLNRSFPDVERGDKGGGEGRSGGRVNRA